MTGIKYLFSPRTFLQSTVYFIGTMLIVSDIQAADHKLDYGVRLRHADLKDGEVDGQAQSALIRLNLDSSWTSNLSTFIELDYVETGSEDEHSDGVRFNGQPAIPDVPGFDLNQVLVQYDFTNGQIKLGRQKINLDNQRHVGAMSFWQNEQTFDAARVDLNWLSSSQFNYIYIANANRISGDDADENLDPSDINFAQFAGRRPPPALGDHEHNTHLLRAEFNEWDYSKLNVYSYIVDNKDVPLTSANTVGASYAFKYKPTTIQYRVEAEAAIQKRTEAPTEPTLPYYRFDIGVGIKSFEVSWRYEQLASKNGIPFFSVLGSLHEFQGWGDRLNAPPANGLEDKSFRITWRKAPWKIDARYHRFDEESGSQDLGEEFDMDITYKFLKKHSFMLRFADYQANENTSLGIEDRRRAIFSYSYNL